MALLESITQSEPTKKLTMDEPVETLFSTTASKLVGKPINRVDGSLKVAVKRNTVPKYTWTIKPMVYW